jgi:hypothetical protein
MQHSVVWAAPAPFWQAQPGASEALRAADRTPQILRFASDEFIEEMLATLERQPHALPGYRAAPETWRGPLVAPQLDVAARVERRPARLLPLVRKAGAARAVALPVSRTPAAPLKLYQPAHQRHYLVAGSLVCQQPGLPDRAIDPARHRVSFVLRRLFPKNLDPKVALPDIADRSAWHEYAWVLGPKGVGQWHRLDSADDAVATRSLFEGEERLPMFPARFVEAGGQPRRLFVGGVPTGKREAYQGGQALAGGTPASGSAPMDPRAVQFHADVLAPWKQLLNKARDLNHATPERVRARNGNDPPAPGSIDANLLRDLRGELQLASWYLLLGLREFLALHLPQYLAWIDGGATGSPPAGLADFHGLLAGITSPAGLSTGSHPLVASPYVAADLAPGLVTALRLIGPASQQLELAMTGSPGFAASAFRFPAAPDPLVKPAGWPGFLFLFADPLQEVPRPATAPPTQPGDYEIEKQQARIDALADRLPFATMASDAPTPLPTIASMQPTDMREAWYQMRLVYERPDCEPFEASVISAPSAPFQMAGFFDPDAPARPIRIGLPVDISPTGLRKFDKNAVMVMSDMLCGQIDRFKGVTFGDLVLSVLPWPFHKDFSVQDKGPCKQGDLSLGVMCSLSIPIITICALILLMIIVALLDLIFRWLPFFVVCFPLPGFKGRKP